MRTNAFRAAATALLVSAAGAVCQAAPSFHMLLAKAVKAVQSEASEEPAPYEWMLPSVIQAGLVQRGISGFVGVSGASFQGRSLDVNEAQITAGITDQVELLYGKQWVLAKGRRSTSRFDVSDNYYGGRVVIKRPTATDPSAWSLQYEAITPDTATAVEGSSSATYDGTHNNIYSVNYQDRVKDQFQLQYADITATGGYYAHVINVGAGRDYRWSEWVLARFQVNLVGETFQGIGESSSFELRPIVYGALAFTPTPWLSVEGDLTAMPAGMPMAGGDFTGLSGFALYNPGGVVNDLRSDFVGFGSVRLVLHGKF